MTTTQTTDVIDEYVHVTADMLHVTRPDHMSREAWVQACTSIAAHLVAAEITALSEPNRTRVVGQVQDVVRQAVQA